jgi:hypothetical protein
MKKILSILAVILSVGATSSSALAEDKQRPNIVDGNPCYEGICIGDSLQSLASLNWKASTINFKGSKALFQQNKPFNGISALKGLGVEYPPTVEVRAMTLGDQMMLIMGSSLKDISKTQQDLRKMPGCNVFYQDELIRIKVD